MRIKLEFSGGMDLLFGGKKEHAVELGEESKVRDRKHNTHRS